MTSDRAGMFGKLLGRGAQKRDPIHEVVDKRQVTCAYQPIVDLQTREVFAYESLARSASPSFQGPLDLFEAAVRERRVGELGRILRMMSVDQCTGYPLFLNVNPNEFDEGWLVRPDDPFFWHDHPVYMEITESVPLSHFEQCKSVIAELRIKGVKLAVDDLGAGFSNLKYIADLEPDIVKLDRDLIAGLVKDTRQFQLVKSVVSLCREMGARVVAEGIETLPEFEASMAAGVDFGQGFLLARPAVPPPTPIWPASL